MEYIAFTDGSTFNNGKKNKQKYGGIGIYLEAPISKNISIPIDSQEVTNNICELNACIMAIKIIIALPNFNINNDTIKLYSDSQYVIKSIKEWSNNWIKNGWKNKSGQPVKNSDLIKRLLDLYNKYKVDLIYIKAHTKPPLDKTNIKYRLWYGNYMADKLATTASKSLIIS